IGRAVAAVSTGANTPSTRQCAGTAPVAGTHAACSVTLRTGSPIFDGVIVSTSEGAVQPASVAALLSAAAWDTARATRTARILIAPDSTTTSGKIQARVRARSPERHPGAVELADDRNDGSNDSRRRAGADGGNHM